ncbi:MAG: hypothetical protein C9356_15600 [Oleiphilus sp.]|nr:MAG: hypothetical protein C9356_15600 [Oleiphilus sp.]
MTGVFFQVKEERDFDVAKSILSESFANDPLVNFLSGHEDFPEFLFSVILPFYQTNGEIWLSEDQSCAAVLLPPNITFKLSPTVRQSKELLTKFGLKTSFRLIYLDWLLNKNHNAVISEPHYYIFAVGVKNLRQSSGEGGRMIRFLFDHILSQGYPLYAENSNVDNNTDPFRHLGFNLMDKVKVGKSDTYFVPMTLTE